jgi:type IV secretory pathway VirJ component
MDAVASGLAARGSLVAGIDTREWLAALKRSGAPCVAPGAELADLGHYLRERYPVRAQTPVLIGHSAGASLAYVALAQSQP